MDAIGDRPWIASAGPPQFVVKNCKYRRKTLSRDRSAFACIAVQIFLPCKGVFCGLCCSLRSTCSLHTRCARAICNRCQHVQGTPSSRLVSTDELCLRPLVRYCLPSTIGSVCVYVVASGFGLSAREQEFFIAVLSRKSKLTHQ